MFCMVMFGMQHLHSVIGAYVDIVIQFDLGVVQSKQL